MTRGELETHGFQVIVHLGGLPRYVTHYAAIAAASLPSARTYLITDTHRQVGYPGIERVRAQALVGTRRISQIQDALSRLGIDPRWRSGYWTQVFMRFALVEAFMNQLGDRGFALQLESDILSTLSPAMIALTVPHLDGGCYMPFIDEETAGPGLMLAKSPSHLAEACRFTLEALFEQITFSDMAALALAQESGLVKSLPSHASESPFAMRFEGGGEIEYAQLVFDAAATGQFLFGIDPRNNNGIVKSGYLETRGGLDPGSWKDWRIQEGSDSQPRVTCDMGSSRAVFANLHIHAKSLVPPPASGNKSWKRTLDEANGNATPRAQLRPSAMRLASIRALLRRRP